jgi:hypothetical protein
VATDQDRIDQLIEEERRLRALATATEDAAERESVYTEKLKLRAQASADALEAQKELVKLLELQVKTGDASIDTLNNERKALEDFEKTAKKAAGAQKKFGTSLFESMGFVSDMDDRQKGLLQRMKESESITDDLAESFKELKDSGALTEGVMRGIDDILLGLATSAFKLAMANDTAMASFNKATGTGGQYEEQLKGLYRRNNELSVSMEDNANAFGALFNNMSQFSALSSTMQDNLTEQAALLEKVGVSNEDYAASIETSTKMLGMSTEAGMETTNQLTAMAQDMGVAPGKLVKDFAAAGPTLAKFGSQGVDAFRDLAAAAKATGLETSRLLDITGKFDTFEDAAKSVGSLNAILGGDYLNSMDMISTTDPTERLKKMRDAIDSAGLSFDSMGYYERIALQEAMGLKDVGELAMMMSGDIDQFSSSTQMSAQELMEQRESAAAAQDVMQKLQAILAENSETFLGLAESLITIVDKLTFFAPLLRLIIPAMIGLSVATKALALAQMSQAMAAEGAAMSMNKFKLIVLAVAGVLFLMTFMSNFVEGIFKLGFAFIAMSVGVRLLNGVGKNVIPVLLAMGAAMLMIGAGVFMAATGFANLADSMSQLNPAQLQAFNTALMIFGVIFVALLVALGVLAYSGLGPAAVGIMLGFGAAVLMIGIGVGIAAAGIGLMGEGLATMFEAIDPIKMLSFVAFIASLVLGAYLMPAAALGLGALAFGFGGLALALGLIKTADLEAIASFAEHMGNIEATLLTLVADEIERIAVAIDSIPTAKSILLTSMFKAGVVGPIGGAAGGGGKETKPTPPAPIELHIEVHVGNEKLDEHIREISSEEQESALTRTFSEIFRN